MILKIKMKYTKETLLLLIVLVTYVSAGLVSGVGGLKCKPGYKKMPNGDCKKITKFEP